MNSRLQGLTPDIGGRRLSLDGDRVVTEGGRRPMAGDGIGRALASLVDPTVAADATERAVTVDQTNTSVIVEERLIVKIVSSLGTADRSALLLNRLADAGSVDVERLAGVVEWAHPIAGSSVLAVVTEYLPGAADGWTWAVDDVIAHLAGGTAPLWPQLLGAVTARIHTTLGTNPKSDANDAGQRRSERASAALRQATSASTGELGQRLRNRIPALERDIESLTRSAPGWVFPIHGDLHVGQVLRSSVSGTQQHYTVIDFDGDPGLAAREREHPDSAARDIAHFRVSIDLVASVVQKRLQRRDDQVKRWADRARAEFLAAYLDELPNQELIDIGLLPGFEAEQLIAELLYADRFLPRWKYAPDAAIEYRFAADPLKEETPWTPPPSEPILS